MKVRKKKLGDLKNVGKATLRYLEILGVHSIDDLMHRDATQLFHQLETQTAQRFDPCMWDVFAAIIHEAKTGEPTSWWAWTKQRKILQKSGKFTHVV